MTLLKEVNTALMQIKGNGFNQLQSLLNTVHI